MNALLSPEQQVVLQVVRGERPWADLASIGIAVQRQGSEWRFSNPSRIVAAAKAGDLAEGLLRFSESPDELRAWASLVLAGSDFVDLQVEAHPLGELLLGALWDASFGHSVKPVVLQAAEELLARSR